ncbi:MAG: hypothetical protein ABSG04_15660, partial [Verrucomicrobiota bacterium]
HTVSFRFVVFLYSDNNVLPEGNLPCHFALNVIKPYICIILFNKGQGGQTRMALIQGITLWRSITCKSSVSSPVRDDVFVELKPKTPSAPSSRDWFSTRHPFGSRSADFHVCRVAGFPARRACGLIAWPRPFHSAFSSSVTPNDISSPERQPRAKHSGALGLHQESVVKSSRK